MRNRGNEGKKSAEEKRGDEMRMRDGEETEEKEKEEEEKKISPIQIRPPILSHRDNLLISTRDCRSFRTLPYMERCPSISSYLSFFVPLYTISGAKFVISHLL